MIRLGRDRPHVVLLPVLLSKNLRKLNLTKQTKVVSRSSEDPQGRIQSSLQTTDIPLWKRRWTMRFQILTAKILFDFYAYDFTNGTFVVSRPTGGT